jgi:hypothetical protein
LSPDGGSVSNTEAVGIRPERDSDFTDR